ncbi:heavy metal translocating P-type ATPase [Bifidobacterium pseudocatenulatum]|uniref:heavy metal translocating P-type ATPase n=1 Tax=Bifidobacterium pseudocatenulatum TaxID=28026 RepID=UPI0022E4C45B|nr:heavy metal translocating P-type ATPase [Bifidobacterium pseudocatenulatum]
MQALIAVIVAFIVTAAVLWFFFAPRKAFRARVDNGVQEAVVEVKGGYSPAIIEAEAGLPLRLIFDRKEDGECSSHVVFSDFGVDLALPAFRTTTLTLHPNEPGEYGFACGMNMLHGTLRVVPGKHHAAMAKEHSESEENPNISEENPNIAESHVHIQSQPSVVAEKSYESAESSDISSDSSNDSSESREMRTLIARLIASAIVTIPVFGSTMLMLYPMPNWVQFVLMLPVMCYAALPIFRSGFAAIIHRSPEMNALVSLGTVCAFAHSCVVTFIPQILPENAREPYFEAVGVVITLMLVGQLLEARARVGTGEAMRALAGLQPKNARVVRGEIEEEIPVEQVAVGDIIAIRPGEQLPVDGVVIAGSSAVDESMITGESMPVVKQAGSSVTGATINGTGSLRYRATKVGKDTVLAQIIGLVQSAQSSKAPVQRMADKISGIFVPIVVLIAVWSCALWFAFGPEPRVVHALVAAVSVLLIACPCALGLATPLSVTVSTGRAAQMGVLIRSAEALETCGKINAVVLDKTGTITAGKPSLTDVFPLGKWRKMPDDLLAITASAERDSEHPLAAAIVAGAQEKHLTLGETTQFRAISGRGVTAHVALPLISANNPTVAADESSASSVTFESSISSPETAMYNVAVGNTDLIDDLDVAMPSVGDEDLDDIIATMERLSAEGKTPMLAAIDGELAGIVAVADTVKADSQQAIAALKSRGVNVVMLTGDNETTARAVANQVGVSNVIAGVRPENKADEIAKLQAQGYTVAMVGDGINDAPALARANVGFAIGTGTDVAIQSADVTLMNGSLMGLVHALDLTHATMRNIAQNLGFALGYNSVGISIAAGVLYPFTGMMLNPMIAGAAMAFSSLCVVTNASRLRLFDPDKAVRAANKTYQVRQSNPNDNNHSNHSQKGFIMGLFSDHKAKKENAHESMEGMRSCCGGHAANGNQSAHAKDPVCGMSVDPATAAATREYNGTTYYFCNPGCAAKFEQNPTQYLA